MSSNHHLKHGRYLLSKQFPWISIVIELRSQPSDSTLQSNVFINDLVASYKSLQQLYEQNSKEMLLFYTVIGNTLNFNLYFLSLSFVYFKIIFANDLMRLVVFEVNTRSPCFIRPNILRCRPEFYKLIKYSCLCFK